MAYLDYSLIVIFFVGLFILVVLVSRSPSEPATSKNAATTQTIASRQENKLAYGFLASLFVLFLVLTFLSERKQSGVVT